MGVRIKTQLGHTVGLGKDKIGYLKLTKHKQTPTSDFSEEHITSCDYDSEFSHLSMMCNCVFREFYCIH